MKPAVNQEERVGQVASRCDGAMYLAIVQHFNLPHGPTRDAALRDAADYAAVALALRHHLSRQQEGR